MVMTHCNMRKKDYLLLHPSYVVQNYTLVREKQRSSWNFRRRTKIADSTPSTSFQALEIVCI
jgi:hypothetical protein